jgi:cyclopropane fatty-acyl-phospholipid synthase-like methyltransferase
MSRLHDDLIANYAEQYARVNVSVDPATAPPRHWKALDLTHGDLIARLPAGSEILDLGCGTGYLLSWLGRHPGIVPVGVDASAGQAALARRFLPDLDIESSEGLDYLRRNAGRFKGIFCTDVLEHLPGDDLRLEWLDAAREALQPGGFFYCRVPNAANLLGARGRYMDLTHDKIFTETSLLQLLEAARFRSCRVVPIRAAHLSGRVRLAAEALLHKMIYRLCGNTLERVFTGNVCAVGFPSE